MAYCALIRLPNKMMMEKNTVIFFLRRVHFISLNIPYTPWLQADLKNIEPKQKLGSKIIMSNIKI